MAGNSLRYECKCTDIALSQGVYQCTCRTVLFGGHRAAGRLLVTDIVQRSIVCSSFDRSQVDKMYLHNNLDSVAHLRVKWYKSRVSHCEKDNKQ